MNHSLNFNETPAGHVSDDTLSLCQISWNSMVQFFLRGYSPKLGRVEDIGGPAKRDRKKGLGLMVINWRYLPLLRQNIQYKKQKY